jgi:hypothetical protein
MKARLCKRIAPVNPKINFQACLGMDEIEHARAGERFQDPLSANIAIMLKHWDNLIYILFSHCQNHIDMMGKPRDSVIGSGYGTRDEVMGARFFKFADHQFKNL